VESLTEATVLQRLRVEQIALIEHIELEFEPGLNVITGETGAGKSLLVDSLQLALGERAGAELLREGAERAVVEALFRIDAAPALRALLAQHGYELQGDELLLRRELHRRGSSRCFLNDSPAPLALVRQLGEMLVDFHGQHEQQSLLRVETHGRLLDNAGGLEALRHDYERVHAELRRTVEQLQSLQAQRHELEQQREWLRFQLRELAELNPQPGEEEELDAQLRRIEHAERLYALSMQLHELLYGGSDAVRDRLIRARNLLEELSRIDTQFAPYVAECHSLVVSVEELARFVQRYSSALEFEPEQLEQIRRRRAQLQLLRKRYGSIEAALEQKQRWEEQLRYAEHIEEHLQELQQRQEALREELARCAQRLHAKRVAVARKLERAVEQFLAQLGIPYSQFRVSIEQEDAAPQDPLWVEFNGRRCRAFADGVDRVEFLITTNRGESPRPLVRVASGGEISRIMLALKSILAKADRLPLLVFDEIDAGISGRIAQRVGQALKALAQYHQVLVITHLPQIAACGDVHILVEKYEREGRTLVQARRLGSEERLYEIARLLSGERVSPSALQAAQQLLQEALQ
jgi:DNA repair protein RecN (Recombination protein N)